MGDKGLGGGWGESDPYAFPNQPLDDGWLTEPSPALPPELPEAVAPPPHDPLTGEVLDGVVVPTTPRDNRPAEAAEEVATVLGAASTDAVDWLRSPDLVQNMAGDLRRRLRLLVHQRSAGLRIRRPAGRITEATIAPELVFYGDAETVLSAIGAAFTETAKQVREMAGETIVDVMPEAKVTGGTHTVKVGAASADISVTRTQGTKASVRDDEVVDVLVADLIADRNAGEVPDKAPAGPLRHYAAGAREGIQALRQLLGPLPWRTTDLEKLQRRLEGLERHDLAIRLGHAYGRVASGNPRTTITRKDSPRDDSDV